MKQLLCIFLSVSILMCSCSSTLYPLTDRGCAEINDKAADRDGTIVLRITGEEIEAESIRLQQDSLYWTLAAEEMPGYRRQQAPIPVELISEIKISNRVTGLLVWGGAGALPLIILLGSNPEGHDEEMARGFGLMLTTILFATLGIIGYVNGIDDHYLITDPNQWPEFGAVGKAVLTGRKDRIGVELDKIINSSQDENLVTTALFLKMQYELGEPVALYEELKSRYPGHIYARLAERLLREEYGIRPVNP